MIFWDCRLVIKETIDKKTNKPISEQFSIHKVLYDEKGKVISTQGPISLVSNIFQDLKQTSELIFKAFEKPPLSEKFLVDDTKKLRLVVNNIKKGEKK